MSCPSVRDILAIDTRNRHTGVTGDLHHLSDVLPRSWTYECPTLEQSDGGMQGESKYTEVVISSLSDFQKNFHAKYPFLDGLGGLTDGQGKGVLVAGGAVGQFIRHGKGSAPHGWGQNGDVDVDVFIYGCETTKDAEAMLFRFLELVEGNLHHASIVELRERVARRMERAATEGSVAGKSSSHTNRTTLTMVVDPVTGELRPLSEAKTNSALSKYASDLAAANVHFSWDPQAKAYKTPSPPGWVCRDEDLLSYRVPEILAIRTANCLTLRIGHSHKVQVIFRKYASLSEILHGFDLGSSAVGYDGSQVYFTTLGRFAYGYGVNIVDLSRLSPTYESRLNKYMGRGFSIAMPELNIEVLRGAPGLRYGIESVADLMSMPFAYKSIEGNRIRLSRMLHSADHSELSDYGPCGELLNVEDDRDFRIAYSNLAMLVAGRRDFVCAASSHRATVAAREALYKPPNLTVNMINRIYDTISGAAFRWGRLSLGVLARYCPTTDLAAIVAGGPNPDTIRERVAAAFAKERARALELWAVEIGEGRVWTVKWITENPGGQGYILTGSIMPIHKIAHDWYGSEYWKPPTKNESA